MTAGLRVLGQRLEVPLSVTALVVDVELEVLVRLGEGGALLLLGYTLRRPMDIECD